MNKEKIEVARTAYEAGDYSAALEGYLKCVREDTPTFEPGDTGFVYHMMGNCLVKMKRYDKAVPTYQKALEDTAYLRKAVLNVNLGMAYSSAKEYEKALACFDSALDDQSYETPYKAYNAKGNALLKLGRPADAGVAYRRAALDDANPDPARSLVNLGVCFMALNRPHDAVEAYTTALEFDTSSTARNKSYANLGQAYVATGRMKEAVGAFESALKDGSYVLNDSALSDYERAKAMLAEELRPQAGLDAPYQASIERSAAGLDEYRPPANSYRSSSSDYRTLPPPDDTGFFTMTEAEINERGRDYFKKERKLRNIGLKLFLVLAILILLLIGLAGFAYYRGYGYPLQETVIQGMFNAHASGAPVTEYWAEGDASVIEKAMAPVASTSDITINAVERSMMESSATVTATLPEGGQLRYELTLGRDMLSWKITSIELVFASTSNL